MYLRIAACTIALLALIIGSAAFHFIAADGQGPMICRATGTVAAHPASASGHTHTAASHGDANHPGLALVDPAQATHIVSGSGNWSDPAIWQNGTLPTAGARISIPVSMTVTVDGVVPHDFKTIRIDGTLRFDPSVDTEIRVDTLVSAPSGRLEVGTAAQPIAPNVTARVIFADDGPIDTTWDPAQLSRGAILMGATEMYGAAKTGWTTLARHPRAGETTLVLTEVPVGWQPGDELVVAATDPADPTSDEQVRIVSIDGSTITLATPLERDHIAPAPDLAVHVANLTRNIQFSSANTDIPRRGHMMFMHTLQADVNYASFTHLGRTNKRVPLDDFFFPELDDGPTIPGPATNIRGRYSIHFHRGGHAPGSTPARVRGSVVMDDPGWAYVNHSSNVDFISNVSYRVVGGAYQTEAGDEIGSFVNNIALHTVNPDFPLLQGEGASFPDLREDRQDFAFQGDGFWLHGGGVRVVGNVVAGASGHAYIYWPEGLIEPNRGPMQFDVANIPNGHLLGDRETIEVWWVPIAAFENNTGYAATKGLETYYLHTTFLNPDDGFEALPQAYTDQMHSTFDGLTLWNMRMKAIGFNFTERVTVRNARLVGNGDPKVIGIEGDHFHNLHSYRFENLTIEGFGVGLEVPTQGEIVVEGGTFGNLTDFVVRNPQLGGRNLVFRNISFGDPPAVATSDTPPQRAHFRMAPNFTLSGEVQDGIEDSDVGKHPLFFLMPDRITLDFGPYQGQGLYFDEQRADFTPMTEEDAQLPESDVAAVPAEYVGLTNQQLIERFGLSFGGALLPGDAAPAPNIVGGQVGTAAPPPTSFPPEVERPDDGDTDEPDGDTDEPDGDGDDLDDTDEPDDSDEPDDTDDPDDDSDEPDGDSDEPDDDTDEPDDDSDEPDDDTDEPEALTVNFTTGAPGSTFVVTAPNIAAGSRATLAVRGPDSTSFTRLYEFTTSASSTLVFALVTPTTASPGAYTIQLTIEPEGVGIAQTLVRETTITLGEREPVRANRPDGTVPEVVLPQATNQIYLPLLIQRMIGR